MKKKVIKNSPDPKFIPLLEKMINITVTYFDGKKDEMHFTDNATGKKWRSPHTDLEFILALTDGAGIYRITGDNPKDVYKVFIPEDYHA